MKKQAEETWRGKEEQYLWPIKRSWFLINARIADQAIIYLRAHVLWPWAHGDTCLMECSAKPHYTLICYSFFREHRQTDTLPHHNNINHCLSLLWNQGHGRPLTHANLSPVLSHLLLPSVTTLPFPPFFYLLCFLFFGKCWFGWCIRQDPSRKQMNTQISTIWKRFNTVPNYKGIETSRVTIVPRG